MDKSQKPAHSESQSSDIVEKKVVELNTMHLVWAFTKFGYAEVDLTQFDGLKGKIEKEEKELAEAALKE